MGTLLKWSRVAAVGGAVALARAATRSRSGRRSALSDEDRDYLTGWVNGEVRRLRARGYEQLLNELDAERHEFGRAPSGLEVMRATTVFYDDPRSGTLRVVVDASVPATGGASMVSDDFIRARDGSFVGE